MAAIAGVITTKNIKGQITHVKVDVRKHKEVLQMLNDRGLVPKTKFQIECEEAIGIEEFRTRVHAKLKVLWDKRQK